MRGTILLIVVALASFAASCDVPERLGERPVDKPWGPRGTWTLGPCVRAAGAAVILIGQHIFKCATPEMQAESEIYGLLYTGGEENFHALSEHEAALVLSGGRASTRSFFMDLSTGEINLLSVENTYSSQISYAGKESILIADYVIDYSKPDSFLITFSIIEDGSLIRRKSMKIHGIENASVIIDGDYDIYNKVSSHIILQPSGDRIILSINHKDNTYEKYDKQINQNMSRLLYRKDGVILTFDMYRLSVMDIEGIDMYELKSGEKYSAAGSLSKDMDNNILTYLNDNNGAALVRLNENGFPEKISRLGSKKAFMHISRERNVACLREFRAQDWNLATYNDKITIYDLKTNKYSTFEVNLNTKHFEFPRLTCL